VSTGPAPGHALASGATKGEALGCSHVSKRFGACVANRDVSLSVTRGQVHAVIGENGAGKSTLMRALYGLEPPDSGEVRIGGERVPQPSVEESIRRKVGMVHQHFMLVPELTVVENVVLGREPRRGLSLDLARASREIAAIGEKHGLAVRPERRVSELSVGEAQRVEIVKALWRGAEVLILDEPTAVLTPAEADELFSLLRRLCAGGGTVVLVTHKLDEVLATATQVTVMRRGEVVASLPAKGQSAAELARAMVGRDVVLAAPAPAAAVAKDARVRLRCDHLHAVRDDRSIALDDLSLDVRAGEIVGVAGVAGNGQSELALAIAGLARLESGRVIIDDTDMTERPVRARQARGLSHVPEDRGERGLVLDFSLEENVMLGLEPRYARPLSIDRAALRSDAQGVIKRLDVRPADVSAQARGLSGGNQQKIVVGRELLRTPGVLLCAQPTRGVDVGAIEAIHAEILAVRARGGAVLLISAELDELMALSDRIVVMYRGRAAGVVDNARDRRMAVRTLVGALMLGAEA
jgi:general nucleoside transport system ATP-binding protein